ncbi:MAG: uncharacterized protein QG670_1784 [Thermoproteota archaeon]|nr:uncharacterized protein [Thermoproteota archaeon]
MTKMNPVVHFEMPYENRERLVKFYTEAFGWQMQMLGKDMGDYVTASTTETDEKRMVKRPGAVNGGFFPKKTDWPARYPSVVIDVDDIIEAMKKVAEAGGRVLEPMEIPGIGQYISFIDTEGNGVSMIQSSNYTMTEAVKKFFAEYEKAFIALEVERQVPMFAEHFMSAGPKGNIARSRDEFEKMAHQAAEFYKSVGQTEAKILYMWETPISNEYSMVLVHWGVKFKKTGDKLIEFDVTYFIQNPVSDPKIIMFIAHQDEEKAMKELGLR